MSFAFIFPGQGSQSLGMMSKLVEDKVVAETFARANAVLDIDFLAMLNEPTPDNINSTINTQPLMLCSGYATYLAWLNHTNKEPVVLAGHSLGEWTALVVAGVLTFEDALRLVRLRGELMQNAVTPGQGAMAAVLGLEDDKIIATCSEVEQELGGVVAGVNFNCPGQVVIAGDKLLVEVVGERLKLLGARRVQLLPVSVPSHCKLMQPAADKLLAAMSNIQFALPKIPVLQNVSAGSFATVSEIKAALIKQLYLPVLWSAIIENICATGVKQIIECGPGKVLSGLNKRIDQTITNFNLHSVDDIKQTSVVV